MIKEITIKEIKPNPFKHFINEGKLDSERIAKMEESIAHGTLPETFSIRIKDGNNELCFGHHRLKAIANKKGNDYKVACSVVDYSDEQMLVDLVRENLTQRDTDYQDIMGSLLLARSWLQSGATSVKVFYTCFKDGRKCNAIKGKEKFQESPDSFRSIQKFLSKNGKTISHATISDYLSIADHLDPKLKNIVGKLETGTNEQKKDKLGVWLATTISKLPTNEQVPIYNKIKQEGLTERKARELISDFKGTEDKTKKQVLSGKIKLSQLPSIIAYHEKEKEVFGEEPESEPEEIEKAIGLEKAFNAAQAEWSNVLLSFSSEKVLSNCNYTKTELEVFAKNIENMGDLEKEAIKTIRGMRK